MIPADRPIRPIRTERARTLRLRCTDATESTRFRADFRVAAGARVGADGGGQTADHAHRRADAAGGLARRAAQPAQRPVGTRPLTGRYRIVLRGPDGAGPRRRRVAAAG